MILDIMAIPLSQGLYALVDGKDFEWLSQWRWSAQKNKRTYYAVRHLGRRKLLQMHRQIMSPPKNMQTHHQNDNGLDNRHANLRICTNSENQQGRCKKPNCLSKYKGVSKASHSQKFRAQIQINKQVIHIGVFDNEIEAAKAYDKKAKDFYGELAKTNF